MSLTLKKVSRVTPPILACPHARLSVCLSVTMPPPHPPAIISVLVLAALACRLTPFDDPVLLSEKSFQAGGLRTALWWGPRHPPAPPTCGGPLNVSPPVRTRAGALTRASVVDGAGNSKEKCFLWACSSLRDGFNEGIWIFSSRTQDILRTGAAKTDRRAGRGAQTQIQSYCRKKRGTVALLHLSCDLH